jgi:hypothetical protein
MVEFTVCLLIQSRVELISLETFNLPRSVQQLTAFGELRRWVYPHGDFFGGVKFYAVKYTKVFNPLTPELNPSAQRCLPRFFTGDFNF